MTLVYYEWSWVTSVGKAVKLTNKHNIYALLYSVQSQPVGQIGLFDGLILCDNAHYTLTKIVTDR